MEFKAKVTPLPKTKEDKDTYYVKIKTYKDQIEGKFEQSELRHLIEIIDNAIHH